MPLPSCSEISDRFSSTNSEPASKKQKRTAKRRPTTKPPTKPALPSKKRKRTAKRLPKSPNMTTAWLRELLFVYVLSDIHPLDWYQITKTYNRIHDAQITKEQLLKVYEKLCIGAMQFSELLKAKGFNWSKHSYKDSCSNDIWQADWEIHYSVPRQLFAKHVDVPKRDTVMQEPPVEQRFNAPNWKSLTWTKSTSCREMSSVRNYQMGVSADHGLKFVESLACLVRKCGVNSDYIDKLHEHFKKDGE